MGTLVPQPVAVLPAGGRVLKSLGVTHKLASEQTGGAFYVCEAVFGPESGSPLVGSSIYRKTSRTRSRIHCELLYGSWSQQSQAGWNTISMRSMRPCRMVPSITKRTSESQPSMGWNGWNNLEE